MNGNTEDRVSSDKPHIQLYTEIASDQSCFLLPLLSYSKDTAVVNLMTEKPQ